MKNNSLKIILFAISLSFFALGQDNIPEGRIFLGWPHAVCAEAISHAQGLAFDGKQRIDWLTDPYVISAFFPDDERLTKSTNRTGKDSTFVLWDLVRLNFAMYLIGGYQHRVAERFAESGGGGIKNEWAQTQANRAASEVFLHWVDSDRLQNKYLGGHAVARKLNPEQRHLLGSMLRLQLYLEALTTVWGIEEYDDLDIYDHHALQDDEVRAWYQTIAESPYADIFPFDPVDALTNKRFRALDGETFPGMDFAKARSALKRRQSTMTPALYATLARYLKMLEKKEFTQTHPIFELVLRVSDTFQKSLK